MVDENFGHRLIPMTSAGKTLIDRFNDIIEKNLNNSEFGIDDACRELGTSRSQLFRQIKTETQLSTSLYIRKRKLEKARELLRTTDMKTSEIAYAVGIDSPQNFSKYFNQEFGVTPTAFRKEKEPAPSVVQESQSTPKPKTYYYAYAAAILLLISGISIYFFIYRNEEQKSEFGFVGNSIAIMPFRNLGSPQTAFYTDGIAEQIHSTLSLNEQLKVISTTSTGKYRDSKKSTAEIANELDVNYILEGSVFQESNKIRINVGLVRIQDDRSIWTKTYEGGNEEVFSYIGDVSKEVANELGQKLTTEARSRISKAPTSSPAAYKEYLQGNQLIVSRTKERLEEAVVKFSNAIEFDPDFADAYAGRGQTYHLLGVGGWLDDATSDRLAEENAMKAIRLDERNASAYAILASIYTAQNKWEPAKSAYETALQHAPNDAMINYWYSLLLKRTGDFRKAIRYSSKAVELDPLHHVIYGGNIGNHIYAGEIEKAGQYIEDGKVLFDNSWVFYWERAIYEGYLKNYDGALKYIDKSIQLAPEIRIIRYYRAFYNGRAGNVEKVKKFLDSIPDLPEYYPARAAAYAGLGDQEKSIQFFEKGADLGIIMTDAIGNPLTEIHKKDPRFDAVLAKFNLHQ